MKWLFFVANSSRSLRTVRGSVGGSGREYNLVREICIVSSSGTLVNKEHTSKDHKEHQQLNHMEEFYEM